MKYWTVCNIRLSEGTGKVVLLFMTDIVMAATKILGHGSQMVM
jgi:hypothetical protein